MRKKAIAVVLALMVFGGCGSLKIKTNEELKNSESRKTVTIKKEINLSTKEEIEEFNKNEEIEYKISAGDVIGLTTVYKAIENADYIVNIGGDINIEKIGRVVAAGKTLQDVEKDINNKFAEYYKSEKIVLNFKKVNNNFSILGAVKSPGIVPIEGKVTLIEAVAKAGGVAAEDKTDFYGRIMRADGKSIVINLNDILYRGDITKNVNLKKGDTVYVFSESAGKDNKIYVFGDVARAGEFEYEENLNLLEAIIKAGGPTKYGKMDKVFVIRTDSEDKVRVYGCELEKILNEKDSKMVYLEKKDIVFIGKSMVGKVNSAIESLLPPLMLTNSVLSPIESIQNLATTE